MISAPWLARRRLSGFAFLLLAVFVVAGCGGNEDEIEPAELVAVKDQIGVRKLWSASVGGGSDELRLGLQPAGDTQKIYTASAGGTVTAFDPATGKRQWSTSVDHSLSAGPGVGGQLVVVGGSEGEVVAFGTSDGGERWRTTVSSEVLATPLVAGSVVAVRTVDGRLHGIAAADGRELWTITRRTQGLTLRGNAQPILVGAHIVAGFDSGKVVAVRAQTGEVAWEQAAAIPRGRTDLERLADIDADLLVAGPDIFAAGYRGRVLAINSASGEPKWAQEISTFNSLAADSERLFLASADDEVVAIERSTGTRSWTNSSFTARQLSGTAVLGPAVVVGDLEGYLHWLGVADGSYLARSRVGSSSITEAPLVMGSRLFVQTSGGDLAAFGLADGGS